MVDVMRIVLNKRWCTRLQNQIQRAYFLSAEVSFQAVSDVMLDNSPSVTCCYQLDNSEAISCNGQKRHS